MKINDIARHKALKSGSNKDWTPVDSLHWALERVEAVKAKSVFTIWITEVDGKLEASFSSANLSELEMIGALHAMIHRMVHGE